MRVLAACSLGGVGHLLPLLAVLDAARDSGHDTLVLGPHALAGELERSGHPFALGGEPDESLVAAIRERLALAPAREAAVLGNRELFGRLAAAAMLPALERAVGEQRPDLILRESCEYASAALARRWRIPVAQVAIGLAEVERGSIEIAAPALEELAGGLAGEVMREPYLSRLPASLDPSQFADTRRINDGVRRSARALPQWWGESRDALVYLSFGTVLGHMSIAAQAYRAALDALADMPVRVLLSIGRRFDAGLLGPLPANAHVEPWVEQADALAAAELVLSHGGSGTMFGALAAGTPVVVLPLFADQFANAAALRGSGAGVVVERDGGADGPRRAPGSGETQRIAAAVQAVLGAACYRERAAAIAAEMAAAPTAGAVLEHLLSTL